MQRHLISGEQSEVRKCNRNLCNIVKLGYNYFTGKRLRMQTK